MHNNSADALPKSQTVATAKTCQCVCVCMLSRVDYDLWQKYSIVLCAARLSLCFGNGGSHTGICTQFYKFTPLQRIPRMRINLRLALSCRGFSKSSSLLRPQTVWIRATFALSSNCGVSRPRKTRRSWKHTFINPHTLQHTHTQIHNSTNTEREKAAPLGLTSQSKYGYSLLLLPSIVVCMGLYKNGFICIFLFLLLHWPWPKSEIQKAAATAANFTWFHS